MKRVCIVSHGLGANGIDTFVKNIAIALDKEKFDVTVLMAVDDNGHEQFHEEIVRQAGVHVYKLTDLDGIKKKLGFYSVLKKALRKTGPYDVLHANMDMFNGIILKAGKTVGIPLCIAHSHTSGGQRDLKRKENFLSKKYKKIMRKMIWKNSNVRLGCSDNAMDWLYQKRWKKDKNSLVLYNPVQMKVCGETKRENKIFTVGRCVEVKNPFFVIDVIYKLSQKRKDFCFYWVGDGPLLNEVKQRVETLGIEDVFVCLGTRGDVLDVLQNGKIFLQPSFFEGLSIAAIEAQASKLKCLVSDHITRESNCGLCEFLPIENAQMWADRCDELLDLQTYDGLDMNKLNQFSIEKAMEKLSEIYRGEI